MLIALISNKVGALTTLTLFINPYQFLLAEIETAIGMIGINVILQINVNLCGVILSSTSFAAVFTLGIKMSSGDDAFWSAVEIQVGATFGLHISFTF